MSSAGQALQMPSVKGAYVCAASPISYLKIKHVLDIFQIFFFPFWPIFITTPSLVLSGEFMETELKDILTTVFRNTLLFRLWPMLIMVFSSWNKLLMVETLSAFYR